MPQTLEDLMHQEEILQARSAAPKKKNLKERPIIINIGATVPTEMKFKDGHTGIKLQRMTKRQRKFLEAWKAGNNITDSKELAGYAKTTENPLNVPVVKTAIQSYQSHLKNVGIHPEFLAEKMKEWLDAKKGHVLKDGTVVETADYQAQLKAYEQLKDVFNIGGQNQKEPGKGRKLTIEEWVNE